MWEGVLVLLVSLAFSSGKHLKDRKCLFLCSVVFYNEYQYQAFPGFIRRVFIIQFVTTSHSEQFEALLELYLTLEHPKLTPEHFYLGTFQVDPGKKNLARCARLFCSRVGPKLQSAPAICQGTRNSLTKFLQKYMVLQ